MFQLPSQLTNNNAANSGISVYHIVIQSMKNNLDEGYVGVTTNFLARKQQHFSALKENLHSNYKLQDYYNRHGANVVMYTYKTFPKGQENLAYQLEEFLRPQPNTALNIAVGGDKQLADIYAPKEYPINVIKSAESTPTIKSKKGGFWGTLTSALSTLNNNIDTIAQESLRKSEIRKANLERELDDWTLTQNSRLNKKILEHTKEREKNRLTPEQQNAVEQWKNMNKS